MISPYCQRPPLPTRRNFCSGAAGLALASRLARFAPLLAQQPSRFNALRPDVASIDHDRILAAAERALHQPPPPLTTLPAPHSPGNPHEFYSEAEPDTLAPDSSGSSQPAPFTAHRDAILSLGLAVPALAAAQFLTGERRYSEAAATYLRTWFVAPETRMQPSMNFGQVSLTSTARSAAPSLHSEPDATAPTARQGTLQGILETLPLVEVVQAIPFLAPGALTAADLAGVRAWFAAYLKWLTAQEESGPRIQELARDSKDHNATSWLLQAAAYMLFTLPDTAEPPAESAPVNDLRHRYRSVLLRAQISPDGFFPNEVSTANPFRNSLFNLDMLACLCLLLSTRFESLWEYQLQDGPGMRAVIAYHYPYIAAPARWPYRADAHLFGELPSRRASLLFCGRPYQRPEYVTLWRSLQPDPPSPEILRTIPVHQPLLWISAPPRPPIDSGTS